MVTNYYVALIAVFLFPFVGIAVARELYKTLPVATLIVMPALIVFITITAINHAIEAYKADKKYNKK